MLCMFADLRINKLLNLTLYQKHLTFKLCPGVKKRLTPFPLFVWRHFGLILCFLGCLYVLFIIDCCNYWRFGSWRIWGSIQVTNKQTNGQRVPMKLGRVIRPNQDNRIKNKWLKNYFQITEPYDRILPYNQIFIT